jgi:gamma-glutamyltranspeptidase
VILNYLEKGMTLLKAVSAPRVHSQLLPDAVYVENATLFNTVHIGLPYTGVQALVSRGHHNITMVTMPLGMGVTQFIAVDPDTKIVEAVSDPRKNGKPAGQR